MTVGSGERREWADWISVGQISPQEFNATITGRFENDQSNVMETSPHGNILHRPDPVPKNWGTNILRNVTGYSRFSITGDGKLSPRLFSSRTWCWAPERNQKGQTYHHQHSADGNRSECPMDHHGATMVSKRTTEVINVLKIRRIICIVPIGLTPSHTISCRWSGRGRWPSPEEFGRPPSGCGGG